MPGPSARGDFTLTTRCGLRGWRVISRRRRRRPRIMLEAVMRRYVTYIRVSTAEQGRSGLGLEAQQRDIELFLQNYSEVPWEVIGSFSDVGSGADNGRPELQRA